jgi:hypothetical protein
VSTAAASAPTTIIAPVTWFGDSRVRSSSRVR